MGSGGLGSTQAKFSREGQCGALLSACAFREHPWDLPQFSPRLGLCTWLSGALIPASPLLLCPLWLHPGCLPTSLTLLSPHWIGRGGGRCSFLGFWDTCLSLWLMHPPLLPLFTPSLPLAGSLDEYMSGLWGQTLMGSNPGPTQPL